MSDYRDGRYFLVGGFKGWLVDEYPTFDEPRPSREEAVRGKPPSPGVIVIPGFDTMWMNTMSMPVDAVAHFPIVNECGGHDPNDPRYQKYHADTKKVTRELAAECRGLFQTYFHRGLTFTGPSGYVYETGIWVRRNFA